MDRHRLAEQLRGVMAGRVEVDVPLAPLTTYRLGGPAALYVEPSSADDLAAAGEVLRAAREQGDLPVVVLGRGSNTVVSDAGWPGVVLRLGTAFSWVIPLRDWPGAQASGEGLAAGSATPLPHVGNWAARRGLTGLEFTVGVPGSIGGAVRMNAGAHGQQIGDVLLGARVFSLDSFAIDERGRDDLDLAYRHSNLTERDVVVDAAFALNRAPESEVRARMKQWRTHRAATQPGALANAGSTFMNPPGDSAGRLVEAAGLKGFTVGGASVSTKHANFFMSRDDATSQDVYDLVHAVQRRVYEAFGVKLEPEVRFVGRFRDAEQNEEGNE